MFIHACILAFATAPVVFASSEEELRAIGREIGAVRAAAGRIWPRLLAEDPVERERANQELLRLGPAAAGALLDLSRRGNLPEREVLVDALPAFGPESLPYLAYAPGPPGIAERAIARMGDEVLEPLERLFLTASGMGLAQGALRAIGPARALPVLERLTKNADENVRRGAFAIIASWDDPIIGDALVRGLKDRDGVVVSAALTGLRKIRDRRLIPTALTIAADDRNGGLQADAVAGLGVFLEPDLIGPIVRVARRASDMGSRHTAANALLRTSDRVANALGQRYSVNSVDPGGQGGARNRHRIQLMVTAIGALVILRLANVLPGRVIVSGVVLAAIGCFWGNRITKIDASVERDLLLFWIPVVWLVSRIVGTKMSSLKYLLIPWLGAQLGAVLGLALLFAIGSMSAMGGLVVASYGWMLYYVGFAIGAYVAWKQFRLRWKATDYVHDVAFTRLATIGCGAFYLGYVFGWWKLWGYSTDAFVSLL